MGTLLKIIGGAVLIVGVILLLALLFAFPTKWLWNWLMPYLFALKTITIWQALGLNILCGFLFKGSSTVKTVK